MLIRALIVMLVVLNVGVAAWWMWRPAPQPSADDTTMPSGIARLQLLHERSGAVVARPRPAVIAATPLAIATPMTASPATAAAPAATPDSAATERCYRFGPFTNAAAVAAARTALQPRVLRLREQTAAPGRERGRGWRVIVPPSADRTAANALAERIKQAGFPDLFVVGEGADANAIALGRFSGEDRAQQHAASLRSAGFAAEAQPIGGNVANAASTERWLMAAAAEGFDIAAARRSSGAAQALSIDCTALR